MIPSVFSERNFCLSSNHLISSFYETATPLHHPFPNTHKHTHEQLLTVSYLDLPFTTYYTYAHMFTSFRQYVWLFESPCLTEGRMEMIHFSGPSSAVVEKSRGI